MVVRPMKPYFAKGVRTITFLPAPFTMAQPSLKTDG